MSKTKGNVLDPTELTATYGADALRYALVTQSGPGQDSKLQVGQIEAARNFINKVWNATRFATRIFSETTVELDENGPVAPDSESLVDRWIVSRTNAVIAETSSLLESYQFLEAGRGLRDFIWSELCDWYIEAAKVRLRGTEAEKQQVAQTLAWVLDRSLRLMHPFMPFATESMWQAIPHAGESIMIASWPQTLRARPDCRARLGTDHGARQSSAECARRVECRTGSLDRCVDLRPGRVALRGRKRTT